MASTTPDGIDVSVWQEPERFNWSAVAEASAAMREAHGRPLFLICRCVYGVAAEKRFVAFHEAAKRHGLSFGAYLFFRQTQPVDAQLTAFAAQLERVGGLQPGDLWPVIDLEDNVRYDGAVKPALYEAAGRVATTTWLAERGGAIVYCSAGFPSVFGPSKPWFRDPRVQHWIADYSVPDGQPRHPMHPSWHLHQPRPRLYPDWYRSLHERDVLDVDYLRPDAAWGDLVLPDPSPLVSIRDVARAFLRRWWPGLAG